MDFGRDSKTIDYRDCHLKFRCAVLSKYIFKSDYSEAGSGSPPPRLLLHPTIMNVRFFLSRWQVQVLDQFYADIG